MRAKCKVSSNIVNNFLFLEKLAKAKSEKKREYLLKTATPCELSSLVEVAYNIVTSRFPLTPKRHQKLHQHAEVLYKLSKARTPKSVHRVIQTGSGLPFATLLVPILIQAAASSLLN